MRASWGCLPVDGVFESHHAKTFFDFLLFLADNQRQQVDDELRQRQHQVER